MKAIVFPGQGSQYTGMGKDFYDNFIKAKEIFSLIDDFLGFEISKFCFEGSELELKRTEIQQLAILATTLAIYSVFKEKNIKIDYLAGLSLGEYTALYPAGVLSLRDLVYLVNERAKAMEGASKNSNSCMLAVIGLERKTLEEIAKNENFYISNINSSQQIVISLKKEDKDRIKLVLSNLGAKLVELEVSGGFHSPFMELAKYKLKVALEKVNFFDAKIPIVSNFTAKAHIDKDEIKNNLLNQLTSPILWKDCVEFMRDQGVDTFFEIGPSKVLRGLIRKIDPNLKVINIENTKDLEEL